MLESPLSIISRHRSLSTLGSPPLLPRFISVSQPASDDGTAQSVDNEVSKLVPTKVWREEHTLRPHKYVFKDLKGYTRRTTKKDWTRINYHGKKEWVYRGKKTTYVSDIEIK